MRFSTLSRPSKLDEDEVMDQEAKVRAIGRTVCALSNYDIAASVKIVQFLERTE